MNEQEFCEVLRELVDSDEAVELFRNEADGAPVAWVHTFAENGLMTRDQGVVVRMADGSEFQVTVRRSR